MLYSTSLEIILSYKKKLYTLWKGFSGSSAGKEFSCNAGDPGLIPRSGSSPWEGIGYPLQYSWASVLAQMVKNLSAMWETWVGKIPWRRKWQPNPVFLPGESPWTEEPGRLRSKELQSCEWLSKAHSTLWKTIFHFFLPVCSGKHQFLLLSSTVLGWCKSNCSFALLSFAGWYWNTLLNKCDYT